MLKNENFTEEYTRELQRTSLKVQEQFPFEAKGY